MYSLTAITVKCFTHTLEDVNNVVVYYIVLFLILCLLVNFKFETIHVYKLTQ